MHIEHGSFTPLAMSATGGISKERQKLYARFSKMISEMRDVNYRMTAT